MVSFFPFSFRSALSFTIAILAFSILIFPFNPLIDHGSDFPLHSESDSSSSSSSSSPYPDCSVSIPPPICNFTVISAVSENYFDRLENLVGSIHYWNFPQFNEENNNNNNEILNEEEEEESEMEKNLLKMKKISSSTKKKNKKFPIKKNSNFHNEISHFPRILIFDLGLSSSQRSKVSSWKNVQIAEFPFSLYSSNLHIYNLFNYAWKLVITRLMFDFYPEIDKFVYLDSGLEIRHPNALNEIAEQIEQNGYWNVQQPNFVNFMTHSATFQYLSARIGISKDELFNKLIDEPMCSGGIHGWKRNSEAFQTIIKPAYECSLIENCISPLETGQDNHRFDQSVLSIYFRYYGYSCDSSRLFREWEMFRLTLQETKFNSIRLAARRWHSPKPYTKYLQYKEKYELLQTPFSGARNILFDPILSPNQSVIAHIDAVKLNSDHPLRLCLQRNSNARWPCHSLILEHRMEALEELNDKLSYTQIRSIADEFLTFLVSRFIYSSFYFQTILFFIFFLSFYCLFQHFQWKYSPTFMAIKQVFRNENEQNEHL